MADAPALAPIFADVDRYIAQRFAPEDDALAQVEASLERAGMPHISVSPTEGKLLFVLAQLCGAKRILEVGTLAGYSTIWMARALPPGGRLTSIEVDPKHAEVARANLASAGVGDRVTVRVGRALDVLPVLEREGAGPFDMTFIDADKPPYLEYFHWALRLSRPGSLIVADNVIRGGAVLDRASEDAFVKGVQRFNDALAAEPRVSAIVLQSVGERGHDGMALAVVRG
jgi:caffeoyl-CoA O-methyltransferase